MEADKVELSLEYETKSGVWRPEICELGEMAELASVVGHSG